MMRSIFRKALIENMLPAKWTRKFPDLRAEMFISGRGSGHRGSRRALPIAHKCCLAN